jgi:hypothetical protein
MHHFESKLVSFSIGTGAEAVIDASKGVGQEVTQRKLSIS